jgi:hypothetical protein
VRRFTLFLTISVALMASLLLAPPATVATKTYKNCTELNKVYKGGVSRIGARDKRASGKAKYRPKISNALYAANKRMGRDKDGIACEK